MPILQKPESSQDVIAKYGLTALRSGADLAVSESGDLALNKEGYPRIGSVAHDAMHRLTESWRWNAPALRTMFVAGLELREDYARFNAEREAVMSQPLIPGEFSHLSQIAGFHAAFDGMASSAVSQSAIAGAIIVVLASILQRFKNALGDCEDDWKIGNPKFNGVSLGDLIAAAANSFRHADEWVEANHAGEFNDRQARSINVLRQAWVIGINSFVFDAAPICMVVLERIASGDFENLARSVLGFANELTLKAKERERSECSPR